MSTDTIIISSSSAEYFSLVAGMILSVRDNPKGEKVDIGLLDLGLSEEQKRWLDKKNVQVVKPVWEFGLTDEDNWSIVGYKKYLHIDADAWVNDWSVVEDYLHSIDRAVIAITPEIDRCYSNNFADADQFRDFVYECFSECRGIEYAKRYRNYPILNAGVYAIAADSPVWQLWSDSMTVSLQRTRLHAVEQTSLMIALYDIFDFSDHNQVQLMPATHNWLCHQCLPIYDVNAKTLVEPCSTNKKIGILHRSSDEFKTHNEVSVATTACETVKMNLLYDEGSYLTTLKSLFVPISRDWQQREGKKF